MNLYTLIPLLIYFVIGAIVALITEGVQLLKQSGGWAMFFIISAFWFPYCFFSLIESIINYFQNFKLK